jgi:hypothetical protein
MPSKIIGCDPQRPERECFSDDEYYLMPLNGILFDSIQYKELGSDGNKEYKRFQLIGGTFVDGLISMGALLQFTYKIEHYIDDYEKTILCIKCAVDVSAKYPDVLVFRYWEYCPSCGTRLVNGYVKVRGFDENT